MIHKLLLLGAAAVMLCLPSPAIGDWSDDFDSYALGSPLNGQGGWAGWDGGPMNAVISADYPKYDGDQHAKLFQNDDAVQEHSGYTEGQWTYSGLQYLTDDLQGVTYFILMNKYTLASKGWGAQIEFDLDTNLVVDYDTGTGDVPIVYDAWVPIQVDIDLDANTRTTYYNGQLLGTRYWYLVGDPNHEQAIAALDLWADAGGNPVYYDDLSLVPEPASGLLLVLVAALGLRRR
ncbi:MAG: PEP-CTERM sorting domain-containing protein [Planctomycetota bacterium]